MTRIEALQIGVGIADVTGPAAGIPFVSMVSSYIKIA